MRKNDFYQILDETASETRVRLNPAHVIYQAHFPGRPITPGACQIQMVTEILAGRLGAEVSLTAIKNVKYRDVISPGEVPELTVRFLKLNDEGATCQVQVVFVCGERVFSKMSMTYEVVRAHTDL